nr:immunoglobulin heavy chain junction region [Mus musculus]
CAEMDFDVW